MKMTTAINREQPANRAASAWITQALSGLLLIVILATHMIAHHFIVEGGLRNYQQVLEYVANPFVFALEIVFVIVATIHALLGVRAVLFDFGLGSSTKRATNWILAVVGVLTIAYGFWLAIALQQAA
jgi:succinate dehydrogenase cytochrome b556 subunit